MQNRRPAQFNVVPNDPSGNTWALPKGAIVRFGKGLMNAWDVKLSPDGTYFAMSTGMGLWWYDVFSIALAFSLCGKYLASGTWWQEGMEKMAIRIWDVATDENIHTFFQDPVRLGGKSAEIPKQYAEIRRNTLSNTPSKNTPSKNTAPTGPPSQ